MRTIRMLTVRSGRTTCHQAHRKIGRTWHVKRQICSWFIDDTKVLSSRPCPLVSICRCMPFLFSLLYKEPAHQLETSGSTTMWGMQYQCGFPIQVTLAAQILSPNKQHPQHNLPSPQIICGTIKHFWLGGKTLAIEINIHKVNGVYDFKELWNIHIKIPRTTYEFFLSIGAHIYSLSSPENRGDHHLSPEVQGLPE